METMDELMEHTIQDLYSAEKQALEAMPQLAQRVQNEQLRQAFQLHQQETQEQVTRLEQIAEQLGIEPDGETCMAMQGLVEEVQDLLDQLEDGPVADAAIIGAAQKMEHYEIASYGTARTLAQQAGQTQIADLLETTLNEEKATDEKLTDIATSSVNKKAAQS
ncbi:ferritin-like metal-binding protein YciE [Spirosoma sp. LMG 31448]|uniref:Ferritin-like metal-binding protein YciE n=2 Tax=Spirosoma utsteinense TaxID=2585773 RepID=A0ABR6W4Y4_9BACT|nr:ferritin-like metal-binding protein YciE [Spirosoma utsteinense]MBC3791660.1 ferritin-like metal-binding protein YciE [Spirosoma utsteinense]